MNVLRAVRHPTTAANTKYLDFGFEKLFLLTCFCAGESLIGFEAGTWYSHGTLEKDLPAFVTFPPGIGIYVILF